ncbi:MAG: AAA family ATPase [Candidatus Latescibacter sp.]|nr:AAA family ATPase [Candidatus Latescibacter sp.]
MEDTRFINSIWIQNLLSFGPDSKPVNLKPLNVLIGPNASGKSNFINAISILQAAPRDISMPLREGGGVGEWIWKGKGEKIAEMGVDFIIPYENMSIDFIQPHEKKIVSYTLRIGSTPLDRLYIDTETVMNEIGNFLYSNKNGKVEFGISELFAGISPAPEPHLYKSILSQFGGLHSGSELTKLANSLQESKIYKDLFVVISSIKQPQKTDWPSDFLLESLNNFALIAHDLKERRETAGKINELMRSFYERFESIHTKVFGGIIQVLFNEKNLKDPIPASRLSDGTLRFLCLLLILCHPSPPPLICIEEPEVGLHPDILHTVAELLVEASKRTQLIVTTHSDILVSALSEQPESVLVCEHDEQGTHMRRLDQKKLKKWLENYTLGELWRMGEIGGNRW